RGGEVEVLTGDGEAVHEDDAAAGGMATVGPIAGFEHGSAEDSDFDDLTADAVDLDPVADANAVLAHEDEPSEEGEDESLKDDGETGGGETQNGCELAGCAEDYEKSKEHRNRLDYQCGDGGEGDAVATIEMQALQEFADSGGDESSEEEDES